MPGPGALVSEVRFYHLVSRPLEAVLPVMLERALERGWRSVVRGAEPARLEALDHHLWTYRDESFLPHGLAGTATGSPEEHPIWLTAGEEMPGERAALFLIDGAAADWAALPELETVALLFDGTDPGAVEAARGHWRAVVAAGRRAVYWAEEPGGGWTRKAASEG